MTEVERLAQFVVEADYERISPPAREALKVRVLDAFGCAAGALEGPPVRRIRAYIEQAGGNPLVTLIGGGKTAPDRAAFYNGALVRYLDFNDSYLAKGETCHPSDNLAAVMAAGEFAGGSGKDLLTALAVAYQVQCRLSDVAPVRAKGFDHTVQGAYAASAGAAKALGLDAEKTANAIAIAGTAFNALRVTRTGRLSNWKGLAYPNLGFGATHAAFLAMHGITGPLEVFEGNKGFKDAIAGPFTIDWSKEDLERVRRTIVKKFNAEIHSQTTIEGILELREKGLRAADVERIDLEVFDVAFNIIGGGEEGDKYAVRTKEQADHSLPYMAAVALLDGDVGPAQYQPERIASADVQTLLRKVHVTAAADLSACFPAQMPVRIRVQLAGGGQMALDKADYEGFHTRPMPWPAVAAKFERLAAPYASAALRREIIGAVANLESTTVASLAQLLAKIGIGRTA
jgi:2-methylcitrate dehydratase